MRSARTGAHCGREETGSGSRRADEATRKGRREVQRGLRDGVAQTERGAEGCGRWGQAAGSLTGAATVTVARGTERAERAVRAWQQRTVLAWLWGAVRGLRHAGRMAAGGTGAARPARTVMVMVVIVGFDLVLVAGTGGAEENGVRIDRQPRRGGEQRRRQAEVGHRDSQALAHRTHVLKRAAQTAQLLG